MNALSPTRSTAKRDPGESPSPLGLEQVFQKNNMLKADLRFSFALLAIAALICSFTAMAGSDTTLIPSQSPIPADFFSLNILFHPNTKVSWPAVPFRGWRVWHALWYDLEPQKGKWQFDHLDALVDSAQKHGAEIDLILAYSPAWASSKSDPQADWVPGSSGPLRDINDWKDYVRTVATRYKGRIHVYELWNEPDRPHAWLGDMDSMIQMVREASQILKAIDPTITVVSPSPETAKGPDWLNDFLKKGGGQYVDAIGYHFYLPQSGPPEEVVPIIQRVKTVMSQNGVGNKPLWNTEAGWHEPKPFPSQGLAAAYVARSYILNWAAGVSRFYWYCWDNHNWTSLEVTMPDNATLRPAGQAYATIQQWLVGASMPKCLTSENNNWICEVKRDNSLQFIVWNSVGDRSFRLSKNWHVTKVTQLTGAVSAISGDSISIGVQPVLVQ